MNRLAMVGLVSITVLAIAAVAFAWLAFERALPPVDARPTFEAASVRQGETLAAIGNCAICHSAPGCEIGAGGRALPTPFGTIYASNITPDPQTGIGRWSYDAFARAMRRGVDREGRHLYPAFPYDHFALVTDDDMRALYAFTMSQRAVANTPPPNDLRFPYNVRPLLAAWKLLYLREGTFKPDPSKSAEWNRGAYLADGLGHCGGCHTPRNALGAERRDRKFAGGVAEGWVAYALNAESPAPTRWTVDALTHYLRTGWEATHGILRGPMVPVTTKLSIVPEADVRAIAVYIADGIRHAPPLSGASTTPAAPSGDSQTIPTTNSSPGGAIYGAACASCHDSGRPLPYGGLNLALSTAVHASDPTNIIHVVLDGLPAARGARSAMMPGFRGAISDAGADDAAADAALIARAVPGRPVRVQWTREQEHGFEPKGPAMIGRVKAVLGADNKIASWDYGVWTNTHTTRPGPAGALLAARHLATPFPEPEAVLEITPAGNGDRNAVPLYDVPRKQIRWHFIKDMPVRVSALRALGAYLNVFALETTMDEVAAVAGADPVAFRLAHLTDPRARDVVTTAAERFGWSRWKDSPGRGRGFAFARYKNLAAYCALAVEVEVATENGRVRLVRAVAAIDSGEIINPDGIRNQTEGGIVQAVSWTLFEQVAFDTSGVRSIDWSTYPILRFDGVPDTIDVHIVPRPGAPFLGTGEAAQGPTGAAIANAVHAATGKRLRDLPLTWDKVYAALRE